MQRLASQATLLALLACTESKPASESAPEALTSAPAPVVGLADASLFRQLASGTVRIVRETLHVWSPMDPADSAWLGTHVDTALYGALERFYPAFRQEARAFWNLYAVAQVTLSANVSGVLLRVPGKYDESRIELLLYDHAAARLAPPVLLADFWGDAGDVSEDQSILTDLDRDGTLEVVRHARRAWADEEAEFPRTGIAHDSVFVISWRAGQFAPPRLVDTVAPAWSTSRRD